MLGLSPIADPLRLQHLASTFRRWRLKDER
jgi:hypothetical protein